jgi:hypothetical protein
MVMNNKIENKIKSKSERIYMMKKSGEILVLVFSLILFTMGQISAQEGVESDGNNLEEVREKAELAFEELDEEMKASESEDDIYDMTNQNYLEKEEEGEPDRDEGDVTVWEPRRETVSLASSPEFLVEKTSEFTGSFTDIVYKRMMRQPAVLQSNPANLGMKHESLVSLSLMAPMVNMDFQFSNGALTIENYNDFVSRDMLTFEDRQYFAGLFEEDGLPLYSQISLPTLVALRVGPVFFNSGVHVGASGKLPGEILAIPFLGNQTPGLSFGNPITDMSTSAEVYAYVRNSLAIGHMVSQYIPVVNDIVDVRVGLAVNAYLGGFSLADADDVILGVDETTVFTSGTATYSYVNPDSDMEIPEMTFGVDFGVGAKLKDFFPIPFVANRVDVQLSFLDLGAKINSSNMIKKEYVWDGYIEDPVGTFSEDDLDMDSLLNAQDRTLDSNFVMTENLSSRMKMDLTWQPISHIMVQTGLTAFLTDGLGYEKSPRTYLDIHVFPLKWLMLNLGTGFTNGNGYLKTGIGFNTRIWDMGIYTYSLGSAGFTNNIRGFGFRLVNNWYF